MLNQPPDPSIRQQTEDRLKLYERAMAASCNGIVIADATLPNRPLIYCNRAFEQMTGYSSADVLGRNCRFLQGEDTDPVAIEQIRQALREEKECQVTIKNYRKDGTSFWNELFISPVRDESGRLTHFIGIQNDITARKEAEAALVEKTRELAASEAALRQQSELLQCILDSIADGVIFADSTGKFVLVNPAATNMIGSALMAGENVPLSEWPQQYGCYLPDQVTPYPIEELPLTKAIQNQAVNCVEIFIKNPEKPDGIWISVNARPLASETDKVKGGVVVFRDISDRKQTEASLRQSTAQLQKQATELEKTLNHLKKTQTQLIQSEKMSSLGQLVAGIAHEINNPVCFIYGNLTHARQYIADLLNIIEKYQKYLPNPPQELQEELEIIDLDYVKEDLPKLLNSMKSGAERIRKIVLSLRNFSRLDEAEIKPVDIHEGIESTLLILQHRFKAESTRPEIQIIKEYAALPAVKCYAGQLNQVFINILSNAIDALQSATLDSRPIIHIRTELKGDRIAIHITDNGPGMSELVQKRLFEPFFTTKPVGSGTGLGLSISYQIVVEKHQGRLECFSTPGQGTEFIIEIPVQHPSSSSPEVPPLNQQSNSTAPMLTNR